MANQNTKEFMLLPAKLIDSTYQSLEDGKFQPFKDFTNFIDDFIAIQPAIDGLNEVKAENATMPIAERDDVEATIFAAMPNVQEGDRYDITKGLAGVLGLVRMGWRKGYEKGKEDVIADLKAKRLRVEDL